MGWNPLRDSWGMGTRGDGLLDQLDPSGWDSSDWMTAAGLGLGHNAIALGTTAMGMAPQAFGQMLGPGAPGTPGADPRITAALGNNPYQNQGSFGYSPQSVLNSYYGGGRGGSPGQAFAQAGNAMANAGQHMGGRMGGFLSNFGTQLGSVGGGQPGQQPQYRPENAMLGRYQQQMNQQRAGSLQAPGGLFGGWAGAASGGGNSPWVNGGYNPMVGGWTGGWGGGGFGGFGGYGGVNPGAGSPGGPGWVAELVRSLNQGQGPGAPAGGGPVAGPGAVTAGPQDQFGSLFPGDSISGDTGNSFDPELQPNPVPGQTPSVGDFYDGGGMQAPPQQPVVNPAPKPAPTAIKPEASAVYPEEEDPYQQRPGYRGPNGRGGSRPVMTAYR